MKEKTCCFTGHRIIGKSEYKIASDRLAETVEYLINKGVKFFGCGGALGFDTLAAETVLKFKESYPHIRLIMIYPCKNQTLYWDETDKQKFIDIKNSCDKFVYVSDKYDSECMYKRNRHMVDCSRFCICYCKKSHGGTAYTVKYAESKGLTVINIAK